MDHTFSSKVLASAERLSGKGDPTREGRLEGTVTRDQSWGCRALRKWEGTESRTGWWGKGSQWSLGLRI